MPSPPIEHKPSQHLVAVSAAMRGVLDLANRAAASNLPVVLVGEPSTGKELIAQRIHAHSDRGDRPLVTADGAWLGPKGIDGPLEAAAHSTLHFSEIGPLDVASQLRLLRSCLLHPASPGMAGQAEVRLIATISRQPGGRRKDDVANVTSGRVRHDLYRQHHALVIAVPPLRERRADIVPLARLFLAEARADAALTLAPAVERELESHSWPGNIAELQSAVTSAALTTTGDQVGLDALHDLERSAGAPLVSEMTDLSYRDMLAASRDRFSREYFSMLLREVDGNVTHAAQRAGLERESLHRLLRRLGLSAENYRRK